MLLNCLQITSSWASSDDSGILFKRMLELHKQEGAASQAYAQDMDTLLAQHQELQACCLCCHLSSSYMVQMCRLVAAACMASCSRMQSYVLIFVAAWL